MISTSAHPLDDDEIAQRTGIVRQNVNQICRRLEAEGLVRRLSARPERSSIAVSAHPKRALRHQPGATFPALFDRR